MTALQKKVALGIALAAFFSLPAAPALADGGQVNPDSFYMACHPEDVNLGYDVTANDVIPAEKSTIDVRLLDGGREVKELSFPYGYLEVTTDPGKAIGQVVMVHLKAGSYGAADFKYAAYDASGKQFGTANAHIEVIGDETCKEPLPYSPPTEHEVGSYVATPDPSKEPVNEVPLAKTGWEEHVTG